MPLHSFLDRWLSEIMQNLWVRIRRSGASRHRSDSVLSVDTVYVLSVMIPRTVSEESSHIPMTTRPWSHQCSPSTIGRYASQRHYIGRQWSPRSFGKNVIGSDFDFDPKRRLSFGFHSKSPTRLANSAGGMLMRSTFHLLHNVSCDE